MKHKHSEVLKAYAEGIECEYFHLSRKIWESITLISTFDWASDVRIKPEPETNKVSYSEDTYDDEYLYVYNSQNKRESWMSPTFVRDTYGWNYMGKVKVEK
jgi:hypothetical protein